MRARTVTAAVVTALVSFAGCAAPEEPLTPSPTRPPFHTMPPLNPSGSPMTPSAEQLSAIRDDLAGRGITGDVAVIMAVSITWNNGSWGCPEPGKLYTQALVPGLKIVVAVADVRYDYRFGSGPTPRLCPIQ